ncbi:MAG: DoxX family protein [Sedimentisphaerales bacterium]|nr:DoxX family protein [Sedimentisphaerales bacterium]
MTLTNNKSNYSPLQVSILLLLRLAIGWHFLYEGVAKIYTPNWSAASFLDSSQWILRDFFQWILAHPNLLEIVDLMNIWGLIFIGLGLILGFFTRIAGISGMVLLALYYLAHPPLVGLESAVPAEGQYLIVNMILIEFFALLLLTIFPTGKIIGLDRFIFIFRNKKRKLKTEKPSSALPTNISSPLTPVDFNRREILKGLATLPVIGGFVLVLLKKIGWESWEEKALENQNFAAITSATVKAFDFSDLSDLKGKIPYGKIGNLKLSKMLLGGNLIGGWAHSRDLIYVSKLVKSYHTREKIFETFSLAEKCGINTFLTNPILSQVVKDYHRRKIGEIQFISDCSFNGDLITGVKVSIDYGACSCYVHGGMADSFAQNGQVEEIAKVVDLIRQNGVPAGIGAHSLDTVKACVDFGLKPDYWMKTLHHTNYWSANPKQKTFKGLDFLKDDNIWCINPDETAEYMKTIEQPWIAFKTLAAGAIPPDVGFDYAYKNGADFICVGMYDFQVVDNANLALKALAANQQRQRSWYA